MPISQQALDSLKALQTGYQAPGGFGQMLAGRTAQDSQLDEMKRNVAREQQFSPNPSGQANPYQTTNLSGGIAYASGANTPDIQALQESMNESPSFGKAAQAQAAESENQYRSATAQGFHGTNPVQEQALYARKQAEAKTQMPNTTMQTQQAGELAKQQAASKGLLDVEMEKAQALRDVADTRQEGYSEHQAYLTQKTLLDNAAKTAVGAQRTVLPEMQRMNEAAAAGKADRTSPEFQARYGELQRMLAGSGAPTGAPTHMDVNQHAQQLLAKYPGRSAEEIVRLEEDPNNPDGTEFATPQDRATLLQALQSLGAR